jgi:hypothetical protein
MEKCLQEAFHQKYVKLNRQRSKKDASPFFITITQGTKQVQNGEISDQPVLEILDSKNESTGFYFGLVASFDTLGGGTSFFLKHISLTIFHDLLGIVIPFFRAEWDASDTKSDHAQPHWHFIQPFQHVETIVRRTLDIPQEFTPSGEVSLFNEFADYGRFHFAMVRLWDKQNGESCLKQTFDSGEFSEWFHNLTLYISRQVEHLNKKFPEAFNPAKADV